MNIGFDAATHAYTLDGAPVPGVTKVLATLYNFDAIARDVLERKRQIGEALDEIIVLDLEDDLDESTIDPALQGYYEAWRRFRVDKRFTAAACQQKVASQKYRIAGTPDAWGSMEGYDVLPDWKATHSMHPAVALQTAAYLACAVEMGYLKASTKRYGVQFCKDGRYNVVPYTKPENKSDFHTFLSFLSCYNWRQAKGLIKERA